MHIAAQFHIKKLNSILANDIKFSKRKIGISSEDIARRTGLPIEMVVAIESQPIKTQGQTLLRFMDALDFEAAQHLCMTPKELIDYALVLKKVRKLEDWVRHELTTVLQKLFGNRLGDAVQKAILWTLRRLLPWHFSAHTLLTKSKNLCMKLREPDFPFRDMNSLKKRKEVGTRIQVATPK